MFSTVKNGPKIVESTAFLPYWQEKVAKIPKFVNTHQFWLKSDNKTTLRPTCISVHISSVLTNNY